MARPRLAVRLTLSWWAHYYLAGVILMARLTGQTPDPAKVAYWVGKGIKTKVGRG